VLGTRLKIGYKVLNWGGGRMIEATIHRVDRLMCAQQCWPSELILTGGWLHLTEKGTKTHGEPI
jgi:hypothetical protein